MILCPDYEKRLGEIDYVDKASTLDCSFRRRFETLLTIQIGYSYTKFPILLFIMASNIQGMGADLTVIALPAVPPDSTRCDPIYRNSLSLDLCYQAANQISSLELYRPSQLGALTVRGLRRAFISEIRLRYVIFGAPSATSNSETER